MRKKLDALESHSEIVGEKACGACDLENYISHASGRGRTSKETKVGEWVW